MKWRKFGGVENGSSEIWEAGGVGGLILEIQELMTLA